MVSRYYLKTNLIKLFGNQRITENDSKITNDYFMILTCLINKNKNKITVMFKQGTFILSFISLSWD